MHTALHFVCVTCRSSWNGNCHNSGLKLLSSALQGEFLLDHQLERKFTVVMILDIWPTFRTILFYVFIYIFNPLHVSSTSCSSSGETNCVNTTSGSCHCVSVAVSRAGGKAFRVQVGSELPTCTRHGVTLVIYQETGYFVWLQGVTLPVQLAKITTEDWWIAQTYDVQIYLGHRSWLRHWATSRKVAGSIPDGVIGIFNWFNPYGRTRDLESAQPLSEMSTRDIILGGGFKAAGT